MRSVCDRHVLAVIRAAAIEGTSGDCGAAAMAINHVLFGGRGQYIAAIPRSERLETNRAILDHVAVAYGQGTYDAEGCTNRAGVKRFSSAATSVVNLSELLGPAEAERLIRNSLHPLEDYAVKVARLRRARR